MNQQEANENYDKIIKKYYNKKWGNRQTALNELDINYLKMKLKISENAHCLICSELEECEKEDQHKRNLKSIKLNLEGSIAYYKQCLTRKFGMVFLE